MTDESLIDTLEGVLTRTEAIMAEVSRQQRHQPTPCPELDVEVLLGHITGWAAVFAAGSAERDREGGPDMSVPADPAAAFHASAVEIVDGWRRHGLDRTVQTFSGDGSPGRMVFGMTVMEYLAHGWDLARATGQPPGFDNAAAELALAQAHDILRPEYRGPQSFGPIVPVADDAPALDRFLGFMGRDPDWSAGAPS